MTEMRPSLLSLHGIPLWSPNGPPWPQLRRPLLCFKLFKVQEENYKMKYERRKGEVEVSAARSLDSDWLSSVQQTLWGEAQLQSEPISFFKNQ